jgi:hypothetical protein
MQHLRILIVILIELGINHVQIIERGGLSSNISGKLMIVAPSKHNLIEDLITLLAEKQRLSMKGNLIIWIQYLNGDFYTILHRNASRCVECAIIT